MNKKNNNPLVSICMISYNHQKFISQALDSILMQKVKFDYEIVIGEDCSLDNTRNILLDYNKKHPNLLNLIFRESNLGYMQNLKETLNVCKGKYIAMIDGDDVWTDEFKLQKQFDFLENNPEFGLVYTDVDIIDENGEFKKNPFFDNIRKKFRSGNLFFELLQENFIPALTTFFRSSLFNKIPLNFKYVQDIWLWLVFSMQTKFHYLPEITAYYREHKAGLSKDDNFFYKTYPFIKSDILNKIYKQYGKLSVDNKKIIFYQVVKLLKDKHLSIIKKNEIIYNYLKIFIFR